MLKYRFMKNTLVIYCISLLCTLLLIPVRKATSLDTLLLSSQLSLLIGGIAYFCMTVWMLCKFIGKLSVIHIVLTLLAGILLIRLPFHLWRWNDSLVTLPDLLGHCFAILLGYIFFKFSKNKRVKYVIVMFSLFIYIVACWKYSYWFNFLGINIH